MGGLRVFSRVPREEVIRRLRAFKRVARERYPGIVEVILVGSVARGEHGPFSDVDVVVVYGGEEPDYAWLKVKLSEALDLPADLILLEASRVERLPPRVRREWIEEGVRV